MANFITILTITFLIPIIILPKYIDNMFDIPKTLVMMIGVGLLVIFNVQKLNAIPKIVLALIGYGLVSFLYTKNPYYTKVAIVFNSCGLLTYYFVSQIKNEKRYNLLIWIVASAGFLVGLGALLQFYNAWSVGQGNIISTIGNSNFLGVYLIFPLFASLALLFYADRYWKLVAEVMFMVIFAAFFLARARAPWIAFALASVPFAIILIRRFSWVTWPRVLISVAIGLALVIAGATSNVVRERIAITKIFDTKSFNERVLGYIPAAFEIIKENPILGTGLWSFRSEVYEAQAKIAQKDENYFKEYENQKPRRVHNDYYEFLVDGGILYFMLWLYLLSSVLGKGIRRLIHEKQINLSFAVAFCCVLAVMIDAFFFFPFRITSTSYMAFLSIGIMEGTA